jgi:hypothetical protein
MIEATHVIPPARQVRVAAAVCMGAVECQLVWFRVGWRTMAYTIQPAATHNSKTLHNSRYLQQGTNVHVRVRERGKITNDTTDNNNFIGTRS